MKPSFVSDLLSCNGVAAALDYSSLPALLRLGHLPMNENLRQPRLAPLIHPNSPNFLSHRPTIWPALNDIYELKFAAAKLTLCRGY